MKTTDVTRELLARIKEMTAAVDSGAILLWTEEDLLSVRAAIANAESAEASESIEAENKRYEPAFPPRAMKVAERVASEKRTFEQREQQLANVLQKPSPLNPPYSFGYIEDVPGEKFWVIGADGILFARIPASDDRQAETLCAMLNAANSVTTLTADNAAKDRRIEELESVLRDIASNYDHENDAHKYNNGACRKCNAESILKGSA